MNWFYDDRKKPESDVQLFQYLNDDYTYALEYIEVLEEELATVDPETSIYSEMVRHIGILKDEADGIKADIDELDEELSKVFA